MVLMETAFICICAQFRLKPHFFQKTTQKLVFDDKKYRQKRETENETVNWFHETENSYICKKK